MILPTLGKSTEMLTIPPAAPADGFGKTMTAPHGVCLRKKKKKKKKYVTRSPRSGDLKKKKKKKVTSLSCAISRVRRAVWSFFFSMCCKGAFNDHAM